MTGEQLASSVANHGLVRPALAKFKGREVSAAESGGALRGRGGGGGGDGQHWGAGWGTTVLLGWGGGTTVGGEFWLHRALMVQM